MEVCSKHKHEEKEETRSKYTHGKNNTHEIFYIRIQVVYLVYYSWKNVYFKLQRIL